MKINKHRHMKIGDTMRSVLEILFKLVYQLKFISSEAGIMSKFTDAVTQPKWLILMHCQLYYKIKVFKLKASQAIHL